MKPAATALTLTACAAAMLGVAYASAPLYRLFCAATGYGGTVQRVGTAPAAASGRWVTVSFDGNVDANLPWDFAPDIRHLRVQLGQAATVTYHARNNGNLPVVGMANFNVQPDKAGAYFDKLQCFCFSRQRLQPGESVSLPVQFYIDPQLDADVTDITLSYTFFRAKDQRAAQPKPENAS